MFKGFLKESSKDLWEDVEVKVKAPLTECRLAPDKTRCHLSHSFQQNIVDAHAPERRGMNIISFDIVW